MGKNMRIFIGLAAASSLAFLTACGGAGTSTETEQSAEAPAVEATTEAKAPLTVNILDCGTIEISDLDQFSSAGDYAGQTDVFTDTCWLINHPEGRMIWDLGLPGILTQTDGQQNGIFTVSLERTLTDQLLDLNLSAEDVDMIAISHSHFDHIGQIAQFQTSKWLVHENELAAMFPPNDAASSEAPSDQAAMFALFDPLEREVFSGEYDVFGDGSVVIFETPGHTPGHTSLQITLPNMGPVLLTGDLYHRTESRELGRVPRFNFDEAQSLESIAAFEARAERLGAKVIIQHEPADITPLNGQLN